MTKKEKFDVAAAALESMLNASRLWEQYFLGFRDEWLDGNIDDNYVEWKKWAKKHEPYLWVTGAFEWDKTSLGIDTWSHFDHVWLTWICMNLNK